MKAAAALVTAGVLAGTVRAARRAPDDIRGEALPKKTFDRLTTLGRAAASRFNERL
jgi:hypothetical protein